MPSTVLCVANGGSKTTVINQPTPVKDIKTALYPQEDVYVCCGGSPLSDDHLLSSDTHLITLLVHHRVLGGKGGFGSLIRATGSNRRRRNDKSACRDISGRRMRDIKNEKKVAEWMEGEADRRREKEEKKRRKLQKMLQEPKHMFTDTKYMEQVRATEEGMSDSLKQGLEASGSGTAPPPAKRPKIWMGAEDLSDSDSESDDSSSSESSSSPQPDSYYTVQDAGPSSRDDSDQSNCHEQEEQALHTITEEQPTEIIENIPPLSDNKPSQSENEPPLNKDQVDDEKPPSKDASKAKIEIQPSPVNLEDYGSLEELLAAGGNRLKYSLMILGLKCGGTPQERASRLWSTKGKSLDQLPANMFAKKRKK